MLMGSTRTSSGSFTQTCHVIIPHITYTIQTAWLSNQSVDGQHPHRSQQPLPQTCARARVLGSRPLDANLCARARVRVSVCSRERACARAPEWMCACARACERVRACVRARACECARARARQIRVACAYRLLPTLPNIPLRVQPPPNTIYNYIILYRTTTLFLPVSQDTVSPIPILIINILVIIPIIIMCTAAPCS
jgi:hypothetical protein